MARHSAPRDRRRLGLKIRAVLAGGLALGVGATVTLAAWNDSEYATTTVTASTFNILGDFSGATTPAYIDHGSTPAAIAYSPLVTGISPGTTSYGSVRITTSDLTNVGGSVVLQTSTAASGALADAVQVTVRAYGGTAACNAAVFTNSTGTSIVSAQSLSTTITPAPGSAQQLTIAPRNVVTYCIRLALPGDAASTLQGGTATATWQFLATSSS